MAVIDPLVVNCLTQVDLVGKFGVVVSLMALQHCAACELVVDGLGEMVKCTSSN